MLKLTEFFGVEEGQEFLVSDICEKYKVINNQLLILWDGAWINSGSTINFLTDKEIEIIPPKKTISEDEKVILRNLPSDYVWIARDQNGSIYVFESKPEKCSLGFINGEVFRNISIFKDLFQCIKWEDEEPTLIADLLKEV